MELKTEGYIFLITSWTVIITLVIYCYKKVLFSNKQKKHSN
jgi:hypothetical protein